MTEKHHKLPFYLPTYEVLIHFSVYLSVLVFAIRDVIRICDTNIPGYIYHDKGWEFLKRKRDNSDYEWEAWKEFVLQTVTLYGLYLVLAEVLRTLRIKRFSEYSGIFGFLLLSYVCGFGSALILLVKTVLCYFVGKTNQRSFVWLYIFLWMGVTNLPDVELIIQNYLGVSQDRAYFVFIAFGWNSLKCVSFVVDKMKDGDKSLHFTLVDFLGYAFYPPTLFVGPAVMYGRHREMLLNFGQNELQFAKRSTNLVKNLLYCYGIFIFTQFCLHFVYINHFQFHHEKILPMLSSFGLYGYGYLMGQFFHHKYVIFYGLGIAMGTFDNITMPPRPRCIARTHKYTDMWKHFDRGLYDFLFNYIYIELCPKNASATRRISSVLTTFIFIYLWHGMYTQILVWASLNFFCVIAENKFTAITNSKSYKTWIGQYLGPTNELRLNALAGANIMLPSILSNFVFFAGVDVGLAFFRRTYLSGLKFYVIILLFSYSIYNVGEWICRAEKRRIKVN